MTLVEASTLLALPMHALISDDEMFEDNSFEDLFDKYEEESYNNHVEVSKEKNRNTL
jgi:hypothetical protein